MISGHFRLSFPTPEAVKIAARDCRARAFTVEIAEDAAGWHVLARRRDAFPASECERYAGRLRGIAQEHDGTYDWFRQDEPADVPA